MTTRFFIYSLLAVLCLSCSGEAPDKKSPQPEAKVDDGKGLGKYSNVKLNEPLKTDLAEIGKSIYNLKCAACHRLTDRRIVGPGFKNVTSRRKPEWIMNMITNVNVMLAEDDEAMKLLEECLTRMPNQNLSAEDARNVLEFLYLNDQE